MIEFGKTLREAREAKGYTTSQLAEMTHILPQIIENLECEDFSKIVAPIYGRGFVKLYCEHVGLDAKPLVEEFMEIFNGNRPPVIRMKPVESAASTPEPELKQVEEVSANEPPPPQDVLVHDAPAPDPVPDLVTKSEEPFAFESDELPFTQEPSPKRDYRPPIYSAVEMPRQYWRFGILLVALLGILALIFFGCRALYRLTMTAPATQSTEEQLIENNSAASSDTPESKHTEQGATRMPRKNVEIPPLYID